VQLGLPPKRCQPWKTLGRARAIENPGRLFDCNCTGRLAGRPVVGASVAYEAWGDCLGELDEHPGVPRCDIDVDAVRAARSDFWQLADRVLDLPQPSPAAR
jgi:predicted amidohydrolase